MRMSRGPSRRKEKPRSASSSCMEETPTSSTTPSTGAKPAAAACASRSEKRPSTSFSRPPDCSAKRGAGFDCAADRDRWQEHCRRAPGWRAYSRPPQKSRRCSGRPRRRRGAPAPRRAARARGGPVRQQPPGRGRRHAGSTPARIGRRVALAEAARHRAQMLARLALPLGKALRLPDLELEPLADENGRIVDAGIGAEFFRQHDAAVRIDLQDAALAVEGRREAFVILRKGLEDRQPVGDRLAQPRAAAVDRRPVQRRIAVDVRLSVPSRFSTERNGAGTETRPFWSSRFEYVATKPSIAPLAPGRRFPASGRLASLEPATARADHAETLAIGSPDVPRAGSRPGCHGVSWDCMEGQWNRMGQSVEL